MTLANFNSNFNWQLRMLKEAAECCGIVPVVPPPRTCCYYAVFTADGKYTIYNPQTLGYEILDADTVNGIMPFLGGFGNVLSNDVLSVTTTCTLGFILTEGDPIPTVDIRDGALNPVVLNWVPYCNERCYTITVPMSDSKVVQIFTNVEGYTIQTFPVVSGVQPSPLELSDPASVASYGGSILTSLYGPQTVLFLENDGVNYTVRISNIYTAGPPSLITGTATYTASTGACATTPQTYCYFITEVTGSCSYSYQDRYGSVFNAVSSPTVTSICAAQGTVVANCLPGNSIDITGGTTVCFSAFTCTPPPSNCLYSGFFDPYAFAGYSNFTGWTLNGNDLLTELNSLMSLYAGGVWAGFVDNGYFIFYGTWFYYYGPDLGQLDFTAPDTTVYPVVMTPVDLVGLSCNTLKCYQVDITGTAIKLSGVLFANALTGGTSALFASSPPTYANIDSDDQVTLQQVFQLIYGPQCYVSVLTIGGNDTITIYDAYDFGPPTLSDTIGGTYTGTYIPCV